MIDELLRVQLATPHNGPFITQYEDPTDRDGQTARLNLKSKGAFLFSKYCYLERNELILIS